jgi:chromosome segregation ATPase
MDALKVLEEKVTTLVALIKDLHSQNKNLQSTYEELKKQADTLDAFNEDLKAENAKLAQENGQLIAKLDGLEGSVAQGSEQIQVLSKEKELTKVVVDDLIKSINDLVGSEKQQ